MFSDTCFRTQYSEHEGKTWDSRILFFGGAITVTVFGRIPFAI